MCRTPPSPPPPPSQTKHCLSPTQFISPSPLLLFLLASTLPKGTPQAPPQTTVTSLNFLPPPPHPFRLPPFASTPPFTVFSLQQGMSCATDTRSHFRRIREVGVNGVHRGRVWVGVCGEEMEKGKEHVKEKGEGRGEREEKEGGWKEVGGGGGGRYWMGRGRGRLWG